MMITMACDMRPYAKGQDVVVSDEVGAEMMRKGLATKASVQPYKTTVMQPGPSKLTATDSMRRRYKTKG
jgi:hypothetical protein